MNLLIKNTIINGKKTDIYIENGKIKHISENYNCAVTKSIDAGGMYAMPALFNTHTHSATTLLRGYADDMFLMEWLEQKIWPAESKMTSEDVYWGSKLACLEMIKSGTVFFSDMYWHCEETAKAAAEMGMRCAIAGSLLSNKSNELVIKDIENTMKKIAAYKDKNIIFTLGPHAIYTVNKELLEWTSEASIKQGLIIHTHLSETEKESIDCKEKTGLKPAFYLDELGLLSEKIILAHSVWLDDDEIELIAKKGANVSHNPISNMKLSVGRAMNYKKMKSLKINVTLGTDGCASNNNLDMLESMKFASLLQKFASNDPCAMPARETFEIASYNGARAFGINSGRLEEGYNADIMLIKKSMIENTPGYDIYSDLVYSLKSDCIDTVICDGRILMENRKVEGEDEIISNVSEISKKFRD